MSKEERMNVVCSPEERRQVRELRPILGANSDSEAIRWSVAVVSELVGACDGHGYVTVVVGGQHRRVFVQRGRLSSPGVY